jgi:RNA-directed DNA polymerase
MNENLIDRIVDRENLKEAWKQVKSNDGAPGVDGMTLEEFPDFVKAHWPKIRESLNAGAYVPLPVRRKAIPKPDGGVRNLGIPAIVDRVIQQAVTQVLTPIFDPTFSERSYGFRPGRSAHQAVRQVRRYAKEGYIIAVGLDLLKFFDEVKHDVLMARVSRRVKDKVLLNLIGRYLRAGVDVGEGNIQPTPQGVPQGGPLSPLLSNIVLDDLDKELERRGHRFCRYADDGVILVKSERAGRRVKESMTRFLWNTLKLTVNEKKSRVAPMSECGFLGFTVKGGRIRWTSKAEREFKRRIREITRRRRGVSMAKRFQELVLYMRGWMNYFRLSELYRPLPELDHWVRRRMRACAWKQWRLARTRIRNLIKLGTNEQTAIQTGLSRKSYWRLSKTLGTQTGMTNAWLAKQGLLSLKEMWVSFHYPSGAKAKPAFGTTS